MKKKTRTTLIKIFNPSDNKLLDRKLAEKLVKYTLSKEKCREIDNVNVIIVRAGYIRKLNRKYLHRNMPTNVISFDLGPVIEIYISADAIVLPGDLYYYLVHGLLHTMGYDHTDRRTYKLMDDRCRKYLRKFSIL